MNQPDVRVINGEELWSSAVVAILCGVTDEEFRAELDRQKAQGHAGLVIPKAWKRNAKELQARLGTRNPAEIVARVRAERATS